MSHWDQVILCQEIPCCALKLISVSFNPQDEKICNCHVACIWSHCNWFKMEQSVIRKQNVIMIMMVILVFTGFGLATAWGQLCSANTQYHLMFNKSIFAVDLVPQNLWIVTDLNICKSSDCCCCFWGVLGIEGWLSTRWRGFSTCKSRGPKLSTN